MKAFFVIVLIAAIAGGAAGYALLEVANPPNRVAEGPITIEIPDEYVHEDDALWMSFATAFVAAVVACAAASVFGPRPRRRRK